MNEVVSNTQSGWGKMIILKVVNLDSSIRIQTIHNGYIYEVESRAGYPENTGVAYFCGFFIYILLLNVKQLLSIV